MRGKDRGVAFGPGCQPSASTADASSQSGIPNAASALRKVAAQIRHRLSDMELRANVSWLASSPASKTSGYVISEVADWQLRQWLAIVENVASGIAARSDETRHAAQPEGQEPDGEAGTPTPSSLPGKQQ